MASPSDLLQPPSPRPGSTTSATTRFARASRSSSRASTTRARLNARGEALRVRAHRRFICGSGCRSRTGTGVTPRSTTNRSSHPSSGSGLPRTGSTALSFLLAQDPDIRYLHSWESAEPCPPPSTVNGDDPRIPPGVVAAVGGQPTPRPARPERPDGMPRPDGAGLHVADLSGLRPHPDVLGVAARARRLHVDLRLRAPRAQAAAVGPADAAVAAQVACRTCCRWTISTRCFRTPASS